MSAVTVRTRAMNVDREETRETVCPDYETAMHAAAVLLALPPGFEFEVEVEDPEQGIILTGPILAVSVASALAQVEEARA